MDIEKIQESYAKLEQTKASEADKATRDKSHIDQLTGNDRVQKAVLNAAIANIKHRDKHEPKVEIKNFPKSVKTPDIKEVVNAIDKMSKEVAPKNIDFTPLQKSIATLSKQISKLPTEYPEVPEPLEIVSVNNLSELKPQLEAITTTLEKLKLDPKIDVSVPESKLDLTPVAKMVGELDKSINSIKIPDNSKQFESIAKAQKSVTKAINDLEFPVANYILPFRNSSGAAIQITLNSDGTLPTGSAPYATRLDDYTTTNVTYIGKAAIASATSGAVWQVQKIDETTGTVITWADGNASFDNIWDNRASLTYS